MRAGIPSRGRPARESPAKRTERPEPGERKKISRQENKLGRSGTIASINISQKKGQVKTPVAEAEVVAGEGLKDDAHRGFAHRQVSLLMIESIEAQRDRLGGAGRIEIGPGTYAENLTTRGLDLRGVAVGNEFVITRSENEGEARTGAGSEDSGSSRPPSGNNEAPAGIRLRVTQIGKECHTRCAIFKIAGDCIMPELGIFCEVLAGGTVRTGDRIEKR